MLFDIKKCLPEYRNIVRNEWGYQAFTAHWLKCRIIRNPRGYWCGYVGVPPNHRAYKLWQDDERLEEIKVHWWINYWQNYLIMQPDTSIRWLGFSTDHGWDLSIYDETELWIFPHWVYRDRNFTAKETMSLAQQLQWIENSTEDPTL